MSITSFPKEKINILLLENIHPSATEVFKEHGYHAITTAPNAFSEEALIKMIGSVHLLGIRSKTQLSAEVLKHATKLIAAGCFCIGTNQVALPQASKLGVPIFNAPYSNTRSVAELVIGATIMLLRKILPKHAKAQQGIWLKDALHAHEVRGKTLGIIGYGNIGSQVSVLAEGLGLKVIFYDVQKKLPLGNARGMNNLVDVLKQADIITLHLPEAINGQPVLDAENIAHIKHGACVINYARGSVVDLEALRVAYDKGQIGGVALDVYPWEPEANGAAFTCPFVGVENALLTPHIGGSTEEAQENIGMDVATKLVRFLERGDSMGSCSIPELSLPVQDGSHRILHIHHNRPGVLSEINTLMSNHNININTQYLKTTADVGYVVLDVSQDLSDQALDILKNVGGTIKLRMLY